LEWGGIMGEQRGNAPFEFGKGADRETMKRLAQSGEVKQLVSMLQKQGSVQEAAKAAAAGNTGQLMDMMTQLMNTREGAQLIERIQSQAKRSGLS